MNKLSVAEIEEVAFRLAKEKLEWDEPIPDFSLRSAGVLESCVAVPFQKFGGNDLYEGLEKKASVLFYMMVKNHPFQNGNKRIAMTTLLYFLYQNQKWLRVDEVELYNFAKWIAASNAKLKDETIHAATKFIKTYLVELE